MRYAIDRIDHAADFADILAMSPTGKPMHFPDIRDSLLASMDGLDVADDKFRAMTAALESFLSANRSAIVADVQGVSDEDANADEYPLQLIVYGARAFQ